MKVKVTFPVPTNPEGNPVAASRNWKTIREQLLLDSDGDGGVEKALFKAAEAAKGPNQKVFVSRSYGKKGRLSVWIVDPVEPKNSKERKVKQEELQAALARVRL